MLVSVEGGKPEYPEKDLRSRDEDQQQTQPTNKIGGSRKFSNLSPFPSPPINNEQPVIAVDYNQ